MRATCRIVPVVIALMVLVGGCGDSRSISELREDQWANAVCDAAMTFFREAPWDDRYNATVVNPALARLSETLAGLDPPPTVSDELRQDFDVIRDGASGVTRPIIPGRPGPMIDVGGLLADLTTDHYDEIPALRPLYDPNHRASEPYETPCHEFVAATGGHLGNPEMLVD